MSQLKNNEYLLGKEVGSNSSPSYDVSTSPILADALVGIQGVMMNGHELFR